MEKEATKIIYYKLEGKRVVPCEFDEWNRRVSDAKSWYRKVAYTKLAGYAAEVSTVFVGLGFCFSSNHLDIFETKIFGGGDLHGEQERCDTWEEAGKIHLKFVKMVFEKGILDFERNKA